MAQRKRGTPGAGELVSTTGNIYGTMSCVRLTEVWDLLGGFPLGARRRFAASDEE